MDFECVVIGGGAAGLSAALVLGRARRRALHGGQSNRPAAGVGGLLGLDGVAPEELYARGRTQLAPYASVTVRDERATAVDGELDAFTVTLAGGDRVQTRRVLLATGMEYAVPPLPGAAELFGRDVFHCPFCHGWEVRDGALAVLGRGEHAPLQAALLRGWSDDVVLLTDGPSPFAAQDVAVPVVERPVAGLATRDGRLDAVVFADGRELPRDGLLVHAPLRLRPGPVPALGLELTERGTLAVSATGETSRPGVFAAGDLTAPIQQVALAAAGGGSVAAFLTHGLVTGRTVPQAPLTVPSATP